MVDKRFSAIRGELQGGVLDGFDLFFGELSVNFPDEFSIEIHRQLPYAQTLILVNLIVVNFFGCLKIARNDSFRFRPSLDTT